jgi:hypothetical protein
MIALIKILTMEELAILIKQNANIKGAELTCHRVTQAAHSKHAESRQT